MNQPRLVRSRSNTRPREQGWRQPCPRSTPPRRDARRTPMFIYTEWADHALRPVASTPALHLHASAGAARRGEPEIECPCVECGSVQLALSALLIRLRNSPVADLDHLRSEVPPRSGARKEPYTLGGRTSVCPSTLRGRRKLASRNASHSLRGRWPSAKPRSADATVAQATRTIVRTNRLHFCHGNTD